MTPARGPKRAEGAGLCNRCTDRVSALYACPTHGEGCRVCTICRDGLSHVLAAHDGARKAGGPSHEVATQAERGASEVAPAPDIIEALTVLANMAEHMLDIDEIEDRGAWNGAVEDAKAVLAALRGRRA